MAANVPRRLRFPGAAGESAWPQPSVSKLIPAGLFVAALLAMFVFAQEIETALRLRTNLPYWDQWQLVIDYDSLREGTFGASGWFSQQHEHRPVVPRALFFGDIYLLGGQNYVPSVMGPLLQLVSAGLFASAVFILHRGRTGGAALLVLFTALAVALQFTTAQIETFILPFQLVWTLGLTAGAGSLAAFAAAGAVPKRTSRFALVAAAILLAAVSQLSFQYGVWAWVTLLAAGVWRRYPWRTLLVVAVCGLALSAAFYFDYSRPPGAPSLTDSLTHPFEFVDFVLIVIGGPVNPLLGRWGARFAGLVGIATLALVYFPASRRRDACVLPEMFLLAQALFAALAICHLAFLRSAGGVEDAEAPRYVLLSASLWTSMLILLWSEAPGLPRPELGRYAGISLAAALIAVSALSPWRAVPPWNEAFSGLDRTTTAIRVGVYDDAALARIYPAPDVDAIKPYIPILEKYGISVFHGADPSELLGLRMVEHYGIAAGLCFGSFDAVLDAGTENGAGVSGWAWDTGAATRPPLVLVVDEGGAIIGLGDALEERPDVLASVPGVTDINSGWFGYSRASQGATSAFAILEGRVACPLAGGHTVSGAN